MYTILSFVPKELLLGFEYEMPRELEDIVLQPILNGWKKLSDFFIQEPMS